MTWHAFFRFSRTKDRGAGLNVLLLVEGRGFDSARVDCLVGWLQEREREGKEVVVDT